MLGQVSNLLLTTLPSEYRANLLSRLKPVALPVRTILYEPCVAPRYAHFITSGMASVVIVMADGSCAEVGIWGKSGLVESFHLLGHGRIPSRCYMQVAGTALRMPFKELQEEFQQCAELRESVLQCVQTQSYALGQLAACNRLHESEARLARWLLMVRDNVDSNSFFITQELLAMMLGSRRTTVTAAAGNLKQKQLVKYTRGNLQIIDPEGLERSACECYRAIKQLSRNLCSQMLETPPGANELNGQVHA